MRSASMRLSNRSTTDIKISYHETMVQSWQSFAEHDEEDAENSKDLAKDSGSGIAATSNANSAINDNTVTARSDETQSAENSASEGEIEGEVTSQQENSNDRPSQSGI